jgi:hypothetical protein
MVFGHLPCCQAVSDPAVRDRGPRRRSFGTPTIARREIVGVGTVLCAGSRRMAELSLCCPLLL